MRLALSFLPPIYLWGATDLLCKAKARIFSKYAWLPKLRSSFKAISSVMKVGGCGVCVLVKFFCAMPVNGIGNSGELAVFF